MQLCEEARNNDGYVNMAPDSLEGSPMLGLVKLPELQARLQGAYLTSDTIWTTIPVPPLEKAKWQTHQKMSALMYLVLASTLVSMPAYTNLGLVLPSDGILPDFDGLHEWLKLQLPAEMLALWGAHWATPVKEAMKKEVTAVCGRIKALLAECIAGRPASIDRVTVKNSLGQLPENDPVARFLDKFFDVVIAHTSALGSGSLASPAKIATAKKNSTGSWRPGRKRPVTRWPSFVALETPTCSCGPQVQWARWQNIMPVPLPVGTRNSMPWLQRRKSCLTVCQKVTKASSVRRCGRMAVPLPKYKVRSLKYLDA